MSSIEQKKHVAAFVYLQIICWGVTVLAAREWQFVYLIMLVPLNVLAFTLRTKAEQSKSVRVMLACSPILVLIVSSAIAFWLL